MTSTLTCTSFATLIVLSPLRKVLVPLNPYKELATLVVAPESTHQVDFA